MKVKLERPEIITLMCRQEKGDPDYGSCLWARFYLDLKNYTLSIESDCGNYVYGWTPTPNAESFLQLLARMDKDYLLGKISSESVVDGDATWEAIEAAVKEAANWDGEELDYSTWKDIKEACYLGNDDREIVDALEHALEHTLLRGDLDYEQTYGNIVHDYPADAKKIVEVFDTCIRPAVKEMLKIAQEAYDPVFGYGELQKGFAPSDTVEYEVGGGGVGVWLRVPAEYQRQGDQHEQTD